MINRTALRVTTAAVGVALVAVGLVESQASFRLTATLTLSGTLALTVGCALIGAVIAEFWLDRVRRHPRGHVTAPFVTGAALVVAGAILSVVAATAKAPTFGWTAYAPLASLTYAPSVWPGILLTAGWIGAMVIGAVLLVASYATSGANHSR